MNWREVSTDLLKLKENVVNPDQKVLLRFRKEKVEPGETMKHTEAVPR
jgi:hypothetical protein